MGGGLDFRGTERYAVERRLGAGGFGVVYQVHDRDRDVRVALKMLRRIDGDALYRFKKEFRALAGVSHPNLIPLHDLVVTDEHSFFTMELVSGCDFLSYVWRLSGDMPIAHDETDLLRDAPTEEMARPAVDVGRLRASLRQLAAGVAGLHAAGKLHRDIKPSNVLVDAGGRVVLLDFGLVTDQESDKRTSGGAIVGTAAYMAPEQALGTAVGQPADWYSVGVMLYEALTGKLPHTGSGLQVLLAKQRLDPTPPRELWRECPSDLAELCMALLRRDPQQRASGDEIIERLGGDTGPVRPRPSGPQRAARRSSGSFVGRREELSALRQHLSDTRIGHPVVAHLHGHSGIGKSALLASFEREVRASSDVVLLDGRCYERESVPFKAVDGVVDALARHLTNVRARELVRVIPPDAWFVARLFPVLSRVPAIANAAPPKDDFPDRAELRRRAVAGLKLLLTRIAERQPLVVQIDDLQWGDRDSVALLDELLSPPDPPALLLLLCYRREERRSSSSLSELLSSKTVGVDAKHAREMPLEPLSPEETHELAERLLEGSAADDLARTIVSESGGSPLFVDELVRHHTELTESDSGEPAALTLEALIQARLSRLPDDVRRLLAILSICGQPVDDRLVGRAAGVSGDARRAIDILRSDHLIRATGDGRVEPYHARIRETLASQLPSSDAKEMHMRLASALESVEPRDPEALMFHWERAGEDTRAGSYAELAAGRASDALAFDRAARYYQKALDLSELSAERRGELFERLGAALTNVGRCADAANAFLAAAELADGLHSLDLRRRASAQQMFAGRLDDGLATLGTLLPELGLKPPRSPRSALLAYIGRRVLLRVRGLEFVERSEVPAEELLRIDACADASVALGLSDVAYAVAYHAKHLELALRAGDPARVARAFAGEAAVRALPGGRGAASADPILSRARAIARRLDDPETEAFVSGAAGIIAAVSGRWSEGIELCRRSDEIYRTRCTGARWNIDTVQYFMFSLLTIRGELREASRRLPTLLKEANELGDLYASTSLRTWAYPVWMAADEIEIGRGEVRDAIASWPTSGYHIQHFGSVLSETMFDMYLGDGPSAWRRVQRAWPDFVRSRLLHQQLLRLSAHGLRATAALAAATHGDTPASQRPALLREAGRISRRIDREHKTWASPIATLTRASMAQIEGHPQRALSLLASAEASFEAANMSLYAACTRRVRGQQIGGDEGAELVRSTDEYMTRENVVAPDRMIAAVAPAFVVR